MVEGHCKRMVCKPLGGNEAHTVCVRCALSMAPVLDISLRAYPLGSRLFAYSPSPREASGQIIKSSGFERVVSVWLGNAFGLAAPRSVWTRTPCHLHSQPARPTRSHCPTLYEPIAFVHRTLCPLTCRLRSRMQGPHHVHPTRLCLWLCQ